MSTKTSGKQSNKTRNSGTGRNTPGLGNTKPNPLEQQKHRAYCWTLNNYTEEEVNNLKQGGTVGTVKKMIFGKEVAPTTNTPHLQGYTRFVNPVSWGSFKKANPRMSFQVAKGTDLDNYRYCSKINIEHVVGMETEAYEATHGTKKPKAMKHGGYESAEAREENTIWKGELRDHLEDDMIDWLREKASVEDEPYIDMELESDSESDDERD